MSKTATKKKTGPNQEFQLKLENSKILKSIIETLSSIIDETTIIISPKEFTIKAMDPSRICLLKLTIKKDDFDDYECNKKTQISLNLDDLEKIMKRANTNDSIELRFHENEQKIKIKMKRNDQTRARTFSLALLDLEYEDVPIDNLLKIDYGSTWQMDPDFIIEAMKDAEIYSEILNIKSEEDKGLLFSSSGQIGEMEYELELDDFPGEINEFKNCTGSYSLTFLKSILKITSITESLTISLKTDHPIKMIFELLEGGKLEYFLAPRVESENDFDDDELEEF